MKKTTKRKSIALGCQGGGAHGAFTWGVLDKILQDGRIDIEGASGTSSGGMNCLALAQGLIEGGKEGARKKLYEYWKTVGQKSKQIGMAPTPLDKYMRGHGIGFNPLFMTLKNIKKNFSPYEWNPTNHNPLSDIVKEVFNFKTISKNESCKVFLCATNVRTAKSKIFTGKEITHEAALASACLPQLFHTVRIKGEDYWDGGYSRNPAIFPLIQECKTPDVVVILLAPHNRDTTPKNVDDIRWRLQELSTINAVMDELRSIKRIRDLIDEGAIVQGKVKKVNMHIIENPKVFEDLDQTSALNADWDFFQHLFKKGRDTAEQWLDEKFDSIGVKSSIDLSSF